MADSFLGTKTDRVSDPQQLLHDANVSGAGAPTHIPERATQTYVNKSTGDVYEWYAGAWHGKDL